MKSKEYKRTQLLAHAVMILASILVLLPFLLLVIASVTDNAWATANGFSFFPKKFSLEAYQYIGAQVGVIGKAYIMTMIVTVLGTVLGMIMTLLFAYALCQEVPGMKVLNLMLIFTMLFNGGLVATYYSYVNLFHVQDTIWALIVPNLMMSAFNVILVKNYFRNSIPQSILEAAKIDGASEFGILTRIVVPLSKPIMATVGMMMAINYWNDWQNGLYYLTKRNGEKYYTIQIILNNINENIAMLSANASQLGSAAAQIQLPSTTVRMAIAMIGILPILVVYPFFQKYFVKGITLGGVKE